VDVVYMPVTVDGYGFIVFARDDLSGWVEARALKNNTSLEVGTFLYEEVIYRHGLPQKFVMDNGPENQDITKSLLEHYNVKNINISVYHPQSNGLIERGHGPVVNALAKYSAEKKAQWNLVLPLALWADRVTVRRSIGYSAFHLLYGRDCLLPVDFTVVSWSLVDWNEVQEREDLLKARMRQLDEKELAEARAAAELERSRRVNKDYFDQSKRLRPNKHQLSLGDLILLFNSAKENSRERKGKLADNWFGPYRIREVSDSGYYRLAELDGAEFRESFAGNRLMKFFPRSLVRDGRNNAEIGLEDVDRLGEHSEALERMDSMENSELHD
jgi:transposase InsO family protein